ncbi:hypothetical protein PhCBS80983_g00532 [Powellomyces hirtus]|uniref:Uncharacterized protein n=1 Tax=Powellomyces hirtus TaxID=109895 RepID=A0A507EGI9_9FUNG|nr:hypothetical protein PhCBS80983_g00532 [Powellomyces hirtus]
MPDHNTTLDNLAALIPSATLLTLYHLYLFRCVHKTPGRTVYGLTKAARRVWVAAIMFRKNEILAVQTLRNWIMASSFLATTAVLLITAVLALVGQMAVRWTKETLESPVFYMLGFVTEDWFASVRFFNHAGMICNVNLTQTELESILEPAPARSSGPFGNRLDSSPTKQWEDPSGACYRSIHNNPSRVATVLNQGCFYYSAGMRCYYIAFPLVAWFWGPWPLGISTIVLVALLRVIDFQISDFDELPRCSEEAMVEIRTN